MYISLPHSLEYIEFVVLPLPLIVLIHCFHCLLTLHYKLVKGDEAAKRNQSGTVKLFVFGDSYVDTGNSNKSFDVSWKEPYGITFPGKPAGRFSDGRVLTDYLGTIFSIINSCTISSCFRIYNISISLK